MSIEGAKRCRADAELGHALPPVATAPGSSLTRMTSVLWDLTYSWLNYRDKHNLSLTCRYARQTVDQVGLPGLRKIYRIFNEIAAAISKKNTPPLNLIAAKIRAMIPAISPRTGFLHPFLSEELTELVAMARLHDILTNQNVMSDTLYNLSTNTFYKLGDHQAYHPELYESIDSWPVVRFFMKYYGGAAFNFLSPEMRPEHITEAADYSGQVLRYINLDQDTPFARELIGRAALYHPHRLKTQASFVEYQRARFWRHGRGTTTSVGSVANIAEIIRDLETAVALPSCLHQVDPKVSALIDKSRLAVGFRAECLFEATYPTLYNFHKEDVPICDFIPAWLQTDPRFIATLFAHRDVRLDVLRDLPAGALNADFWTHVVNKPFSFDDMNNSITSKLREPIAGLPVGAFTPGITDAIIVKLIHFFGTQEWPDSDHPLSVLYPLDHFPTVPLILDVFLSFPDMQDRINWLSILLKKKFPDPLPLPPESSEIIFDEIIALTCSRSPTLVLPSPCHYDDKLAFVLAVALKHTSNRIAQETLIFQCLNFNLDELLNVLSELAKLPQI